MQMHDDEEFPADTRRENHGDSYETFWMQLGVDLLQACLRAAGGVVVRELIRRVDGREPRGYDAN